jgi:hypothetical protein
LHHVDGNVIESRKVRARNTVRTEGAIPRAVRQNAHGDKVGCIVREYAEAREYKLTVELLDNGKWVAPETADVQYQEPVAIEAGIKIAGCREGGPDAEQRSR